MNSNDEPLLQEFLDHALASKDMIRRSAEHRAWLAALDDIVVSGEEAKRRVAISLHIDNGIVQKAVLACSYDWLVHKDDQLRIPFWVVLMLRARKHNDPGSDIVYNSSGVSDHASLLYPIMDNMTKQNVSVFYLTRLVKKITVDLWKNNQQRIQEYGRKLYNTNGQVEWAIFLERIIYQPLDETDYIFIRKITPSVIPDNKVVVLFKTVIIRSF